MLPLARQEQVHVCHHEQHRAMDGENHGNHQAAECMGIRGPLMNLHSLFGRHIANLQSSHWDRGRFVSHCTQCGCEMIKLPGLPWRVSDGHRQSDSNLFG